jgi:hypothetical protein
MGISFTSFSTSDRLAEEFYLSGDMQYKIGQSATNWGVWGIWGSDFGVIEPCKFSLVD